MSAATIRADIHKYAGHHSMTLEVAAGMQVAALIGWLEAEEKRVERERLAASEKTEAELMQPPMTVLREGAKKRGAIGE